MSPFSRTSFLTFTMKHPVRTQHYRPPTSVVRLKFIALTGDQTTEQSCHQFRGMCVCVCVCVHPITQLYARQHPINNFHSYSYSYSYAHSVAHTHTYSFVHSSISLGAVKNLYDTKLSNFMKAFLNIFLVWFLDGFQFCFFFFFLKYL